NFSGLAAARHALLERNGWDVENEGLFGAPRLTVVVGDEVHASLLKALGLLVLARKRVIRVPADEQGRMRADRMPALDDRTIVCIQAGNVNSGAFDPAAAICRQGIEAGAWGHVDGDLGGLLHSGRIARAIQLYPRNVPARAGCGVVGHAEIVGAPGPGGINRT